MLAVNRWSLQICRQICASACQMRVQSPMRKILILSPEAFFVIWVAYVTRREGPAWMALPFYLFFTCNVYCVILKGPESQVNKFDIRNKENVWRWKCVWLMSVTKRRKKDVELRKNGIIVRLGRKSKAALAACCSAILSGDVSFCGGPRVGTSRPVSWQLGGGWLLERFCSSWKAENLFIQQRTLFPNIYFATVATLLFIAGL